MGIIVTLISSVLPPNCFYWKGVKKLIMFGVEYKTVVQISKYWEFVKLDSSSKHQVKMVIVAQNYLQKQFPGLAGVSDSLIQRQLWQQMRQSQLVETEDANLAEVCLRCYISQQIYQVCWDLTVKFGGSHGFSCQDLLSFVLDDDLILETPSQSWLVQSINYESLATMVLKTFDPTKGSLSAWVKRYVKQQPELKRFLLQHGVFLISDWALLNDTNPQELQRILTEMYSLTGGEITQACELLRSYHQVYREERLKQRVAGVTLPCQVPTRNQLEQIAEDMGSLIGNALTPDVVLRNLQQIASHLRRYRIAAQNGSVTTVSWEEAQIREVVEQFESNPPLDAEQLEFMQLYQVQFSASLQEAISQVMEDWVQRLLRKQESKAQLFIRALHLFHCQGQSMTQIAPQIGLTKQYEVSRLLNLHQLHNDIRQRLLLIMRSHVSKLAVKFTDSNDLESLDREIETILNEQISEVIQEFESETKKPIRNSPLSSLLSINICRYLKQRRN
jgi:predicted component of type VI protein secretion system